MTIRDLMAVLGVAAVTMAFTLVVGRPVRLGANDAASELIPEIAQPRLEIDGCVLVLTSDKKEYAPEEKPVLSIKATNPTRQAVKTSLSVNISATSPASRFSRRMVLPEILWTKQHPLTLSPGETRVVTLATETPLPKGKSISITMGDKKQAAMISSVQILRRSQGPNTANTPREISRR